MAELLPRFSRVQIALEQAKIEKILSEVDELETGVDAKSTPATRSADGHHWKRRRGLPIISKGVGGTMPGTHPLGALLAKERGRRL